METLFESMALVPAKLALLFLTRGEPHHAGIWDEFITGPGETPPLFIHAKHPELLQHATFRNATRVAATPTAWGDISLVRATLLLLKEALAGCDATHFSLVSESCVPVKPLLEIQRRLTLDPRSRIAWQGPDEMPERHRRRRSAAERIPAGWWRLQSQWMTLSREAAEWVCAEDLTSRFEKVFAPDEHYFATVMEMTGYPMEQRVSRTPSTWVRWGPNKPVTWETVDRHLAADLMESPVFFARKFQPGCNLADWRLHRADLPISAPRDWEVAPKKTRSPGLPLEIQVDHLFWRDTLVCRRDGEFSRMAGACRGCMDRDETSRILRWHEWPPERLMRHAAGATDGWVVVPMDWKPIPIEERAIFVNALGGIGNQLFQLAYGVHLQEKFGGRLIGDLHLLAGLNGIPDEVTSSMPPEKFALLGNCNDEAARRVLEGPWNPGLTLRGHFQNYEHLEACREKMSAILGEVAKKDMLGVHIRRGDYLQSGHYMDLPISYYESGVRRLIAEHPESYREIIVFSDDPAWCGREIVPHLRGILPTRIFEEDARETLREMKSMSGMVIPNSTFGWWGAWLADCPTLFPESWKIPGGEYEPGLGCTRSNWKPHAAGSTALKSAPECR